MRRRRWGRHAVALVCAGLTVSCYEGIDPPRGGEQNDDGGSSEGDGDGDGDGDEPAADESDPGRVTVHRLNNTEYDNTIRDLLGTARRPALDFTPDDYSYGFDNISEVLSTSPVQVELYHRALEIFHPRRHGDSHPQPTAQRDRTHGAAGRGNKYALTLAVHASG